jgi:hypothetical protein
VITPGNAGVEGDSRRIGSRLVGTRIEERLQQIQSMRVKSDRFGMKITVRRGFRLEVVIGVLAPHQ